MNATFLIYTMVLVAIMIPGISFAKNKEFVSIPHDRNTTKGIQGLFAVVIMLHHLSQRLVNESGYKGELVGYEDVGTWLVGFFFFFSGFGLITSFREKERYLDNFLIRRIWTVLVPFFICNYAYMFTALLLGQKFPMEKLVQAFFGVVLLNDHMWFAVEIMYLYIMFYLVFRFVKKDKWRYIIMFLVVVTLMIAGFFTGHDLEGSTQSNWLEGEWWYNTTFLFFLGMLIARFYCPIVNWLKKYYYMVLLVAIVGFIGLATLTRYMLDHYGYWTETIVNNAYDDKALTLAVQLPMVIFFEMMLFLLMMKVKVHNKVLVFLGEISLEVILLQNLFILVFDTMKWNQNIHVYSSGIMGATIVIAIAINKVKRIVLEKKKG
ncbi:MAG: acyltransferase [Lachnospiraceae bacterium]|nr:acyltransferase [Lachnospiraceae bacterium]